MARSHQEGTEALRQVLRAYVMRNPGVGYCQSMNFVAAMLMIVIEDDELAFWCMASRMLFFARVLRKRIAFWRRNCQRARAK